MMFHAGMGQGGLGGSASLTRRELEVVGLIVEGLSCREAAKRLSRSPRTIENHLRSVYQKLRVRNRVELVRVSGERGLLGPSARADAALPKAEVELKGHALELIQQINQRLAGHENHHYFGELALALAEAFGTRWAGISEATSHGSMLDIIVWAADGHFGEFVQCPKDHSPCGLSIAEREFVVWEGLGERFPDDPSVVENGAVSYVGVILEDRLLGPVGSLWLMDDRPIRKELLPLEVLRLLAPRTAAELAVAKTLDRLDEQWCSPDDVGVMLD
ncbi:hypothetical protein MNBD_PLANCTO03-1119 [hydrothermal vent metagenome]|uniref:HTH luxR-type domain-containing protein n=1 Tax=hydrothermal vent metagenome TaxID=652676 RepID=A0A3B1DRT0_9ZZZZ